jgi:L-seryl-tRNA(Ser) seleniumtransferase
MTDPRRAIPAVEALLASAPFQDLVARAGRSRVVDFLRAVQEEVRSDLATGTASRPPKDPVWYAGAVSAQLARADRLSLRRVINATGVVLHTNLGRAPLSEAARRAVSEAFAYATLELDVETGDRGSRHDHCVGLLRELTGAEAALVVNNNAAAVLLALNTLADGAEVVISRGELVEIGGSFRIPEIMGRSGAILREVGATNRTHLHDYAGAVSAETGLVLKVHRSNFRILGFASEVGVEALAELSRSKGVVLMHDLGSGALLDLAPLGLPDEPTARMALEAGADVVTMSGDKLLGGPQAGIILGRENLVGRMRRNPLLRTVRCDKLTLAALQATLAQYRDPVGAVREIPVLRMLGVDARSLERRAARLAELLATRGVSVLTVPGGSPVGGGAYPGVELPTTLVAVRPGPSGAAAVAGRLRCGDPAVVARVRDGQVLLDPRTVEPAEDEALVEAVAAAVTTDERPDRPEGT